MRKAHHHTQQRQVVMEIVQSAQTHPSALEIYLAARARLPHISLATVYRTLHVLEAEGLVQMTRDADDVSRFDGRTDRHAHLICLRCNRVVNFDQPLPSLIPERPPAGFQIVDYRLGFHGYCPECQEQRQAEPTKEKV